MSITGKFFRLEGWKHEKKANLRKPPKLSVLYVRMIPPCVRNEAKRYRDSMEETVSDNNF